MTQLDLFDTSLKPQVTDDECARLVQVLGCGHWLKAGYLCACFGMVDSESNKRVIRAIAERVFPKVISGQAGYRLTEFATLSEIDEAEAVYRKAGNKLIQKAVALRIERNHKQTGE